MPHGGVFDARKVQDIDVQMPMLRSRQAKAGLSNARRFVTQVTPSVREASLGGKVDKD
jgi:hypothetical protein